MKKLLIISCVAIVFYSCDTPQKVTSNNNTEKRPNILLIVGDDIAFGDLAPYGSEINTPNMSKLADHGVRFTNFHASPVCSVTRGMLLTGNNSHEIGLGTFDYAVYPESVGKKGYEGYLTHDAVAISELLNDAGYNVYKSGKWHLGNGEEGDLPMEWGFTKEFGILSGGSNHWNDRVMVPDMTTPKNQKLIEEGKMPGIDREEWSLNGQSYTRPEGIYSSELYTNQMIQFIKEDRESGKPWFAYMAFTTAHFPVQAPQELVGKYFEYYYEKGYEGLKKARYDQLVSQGILSQNTNEAPQNDLTEEWSQLSEDEKRMQAKIMATYAAMIEDQDIRTGQIIDYLERTDQLDNTLIIYLTDNGPEGMDPSNPEVGNAVFNQWIEANFDQSFENIGQANSAHTIGVSWANATTGGLQWWKWFIGEGGIRVPMIIVPPKAFTENYERAGELSDAVVSVKDIPMTILEYAGIEHPQTEYKGRKIISPSGITMKPFLDQQTDEVRTEKDWYAFELFGNSYLIKGDYKIIKVRTGMFGDGEWHLYNIVEDPSETVPLEKLERERFASMISLYKKYSYDHNIINVEASWSPFKAAK
ncbi:arylsulfatase [Flammeovirga agarivorans]|uniref:Arylsulfatase n=1 Tax=Flammeovirga agarivorans TaxID=2726742 RepID=A0A7X8SGP6_9BACT|nr:arylsulfatase [Flammeovirga agarivorans]NLR89890.1 arylsulfatase [Flammeovirga agarivorans]